MEDQNTHLKPQKAVAESEPETVLPGPRSLSDLVKVQRTVLAMQRKALREESIIRAAGDKTLANHLLTASKVLAEVLSVITEVMSEEPKGNEKALP